MRIISLVAGALLVISGIWCFSNSGYAFLSFAFLPGVIILLSGLCGIAVYLKENKKNHNLEWRLSEGILSTLFGGVILFGWLVTDETAVASFGMWLIAVGANRAAACIPLKKEGRKDWYFGLAFAVPGIGVGIYAFANSLLSGFGMVIVLGVALILQGANVVMESVQMQKA